MKFHTIFALILLVSFGSLSACKKGLADEPAKPVKPTDAEIKAVAAKLEPASDPVLASIYQFCNETRQSYNDRRFDALESQAAKLRASKELCGDGSWKIAQFYESLKCRGDEPEPMWKLHDEICQDWIAKKGGSITARVAYAKFLSDYAWHARGGGYANTVTSEGWRLFEERFTAAHKVLDESRTLPEKDPVWWMAALRVALAEGFNKFQYEGLMAEALAFEPKFWGYENSRAYSLLPRWHGEPGEWEAYAAKAAARPDGFGPEIYARIVMDLSDDHTDIFRESHASWPMTRDGLAELRKKYPDSLTILSYSAFLASVAQDRTVAQETFTALGDRYQPNVWRSAEYFAHCRRWAQTGCW